MAYLEREQGQRVYYESHGEGDTAVVLIHGWGMSCRTWDNVLPALLAAGHRVVLIDHRGCGGSDMDFADMSITAIAEDVVALVESLGLSTVVLNGWSLGGAVATYAAAALGARCRALVLTGGASPIYTQKPGMACGGTDADLAATVAGLTGNRIAVLADVAAAVCARDVGQHLVDWMWRIFCEASPRAIATLGELAGVDQRETLRELGIPILAFTGSEDGFVSPEITRWVGEYCAGARVIEYDGVGHAPFIEVTEQYNADLLAFLAAPGDD